MPYALQAVGRRSAEPVSGRVHIQLSVATLYSIYYQYAANTASLSPLYAIRATRRTCVFFVLESPPIENCLWGAVPEWFVAKTVVEVAAS